MKKEYNDKLLKIFSLIGSLLPTIQECIEGYPILQKELENIADSGVKFSTEMERISGENE